MDPRGPVKEALAGGLGLAPPPRVEVAPSPVGTTDEPITSAHVDNIEGTRDGGVEESKPRAAVSRRPRSKTSKKGPSPRVKVVLNLPGAARDHLMANKADQSTGEAVMNALREAYEWISETYAKPAAEQVGPIPAPSRPRRRLRVESPVQVTLTLSEEEDRAIDQISDDCELSRSELITLAIEHTIIKR